MKKIGKRRKRYERYEKVGQILLTDLNSLAVAPKRGPGSTRTLHSGITWYSRWPPVGRLSTSKGYPRDLVSRLDFRRFSSPILVFKELLETVLGDL